MTEREKAVLIAAAVVGATVLCGSQMVTPGANLPVEWCGAPVVVTDKSENATVEDDYRIGFRSDGIVVWKQIRNFK